MRKYRFIGLDSFSKKDKEIFFERKEIVENVFKSAFFETITVVYASAGAGKTSILKAGLLPKLEIYEGAKPFFFKIENYIKGSSKNLTDSIISKLKPHLPKNSFLDKVIPPDNSFWYTFKRLETADEENIYLILDQFENLFSYPENERLMFKNQLYELIYEQIPLKYRTQVNDFFSNNPDGLTEKGLKKLYDKINIKIIISIREEKLKLLDFFNDKIHKISNNKIKVPQLTTEQTISILTKTSNFKPKYNIDNTFNSEPFVIAEELVEKIIKFLTKKNSKKIEAYQIQIIGTELERISIEKNIQTINSSLIPDLSVIYKNYYEGIIDKINNSKQEIAARKFIENELIFEYENRKLTVYKGLAQKKYELNEETIDFLIENQLIILSLNENNEKYLELSHDALITPVLLAKEKRIHKEIRIEEELKKKAELEKAAKLQKEKTIRNRKIAILFSVLFVVAIALGIIALWQRNIAVKNEKIAKSTMFASYSFNLLEADPTLSYRLAEEAYNTDNNNIIAQKAFFNSFYKSNIFYKNLCKFEYDLDKAIFSPDGEILMLLTEKKYTIITKNGRKIYNSSKNKDIIAAAFTSDNHRFVQAISDSSILIMDTIGNLLSKIETNSLPRCVAISPDNSNILIGCTDNNLYLYDNNSNLIKTYYGHTDQVYSCAFSQDGQKIVSTGFDNKIITWDIDGKKLNSHTYIVEFGYQSGLLEIAGFSPDNNLVFFVMNDFLHSNYSIKIWDWKNNSIISKIDFFETNILSVEFMNNSELLIATKSQKAYIYNIVTSENKMISGHSNLVLDAKYNVDENMVYTVSADKTIKSWKIFKPINLFEKYANVKEFEISNSSSIYAVYSNQKFNLFSSAKEYFSKPVSSPVTSINFSENDNFILTSHLDSTITLWKKDGSSEKIIKLNSNIINFRLNEKTKEIFVAGKNEIKLINLNKNILFQDTILNIQHLDINFNQGRMAFISNNNLIINDLNNETLLEMPFENINKIKFSKDGKTLMLSSNEAIYVFDKKLKNYKTINTPKCILADISANGEHIIWADNGGNCRLITKNGEELYNFKQISKIIDIKFAANKKTIYIKTADFMGNISINSLFISIRHIIGYVNNVKLFDEIYKPNKKELEIITNQQKSI